MRKLRKKIYVAAGYNTIFFGPGRKEFNPNKPMPSFEVYLKETAEGTCSQLKNCDFDEGVIGSFMAARFINQANLPGFLPFMVPSLLGKPCTAVEGACGTGGRAIATGIKGVLADLSDMVFVSAFEIQNTVKSLYGADILAGAAYYSQARKNGQAFFFPGLFSERAGSYFHKYGNETARRAMARWYELAILNARINPKAQEYHNQTKDLFAAAMTEPNPELFVPYLNLFDCSKVSDGASSLVVLSEEGLQKSGVNKNDVVEIVGIGAAEGDITKPPTDLTELSMTHLAVQKALEQAGIALNDIAVLEVHDCFSITALLTFEAIGFAEKGKGSQFVLEGNTELNGKIPTNPSGGLQGFGHPTGASGIRQMVDLLHQFTGKAANQVSLKSPYGMMISMGGNDKTVTCIIVKKS